MSAPRTGPLRSDDDVALNARVRGGDRAAFQLLVLRHEARLRAFLGRLAGPAGGDDLAQETFLRAWLRAADYRGDGAYGAWLCGIGWRLFLDGQRKAARRSALDDPAEPMTSSDDDNIGPDARLDLHRMLARLRPAEQASLVLCDGHGWTHAEAAAILGLPLGTVKSLVQRGKARLHAMLVGEDA